MNRVTYNNYYSDDNNNFRTVVVSSSPDGSRDVRGSVGCTDMARKEEEKRVG